MTLADRIAGMPGWDAVTALPTTIGPVALVAVGPGGVFLVQSAVARGASTPADVPERSLTHAWALARHLGHLLGVPVTPVLAVDARLDGLGGRRRGVQVLRRTLAPNWLAERPPALDPPSATAVLARLAALGGDVCRPVPAQRAPDVTPLASG